MKPELYAAYYNYRTGEYDYLTPPPGLVGLHPATLPGAVALPAAPRDGQDAHRGGPAGAGVLREGAGVARRRWMNE